MLIGATMTRHAIGVRFLVLAFAVFVMAVGQHLYANDRTSKTPPAHTTVCAIVNHPERFIGRIVMVRGNAALGFESFTLNDWSDASCSGNIELDYPESLPNDPEFTKFLKLVGEVRPSDPIYHPCSGDPCFRYSVKVTITGKLKHGFGSGANGYLEIRSVSHVVASEIEAEPSQAATLPMAPLPVFPIPASQRPVPPKDPCLPEILDGSTVFRPPRFSHNYLKSLETLPIISFQVLENGGVANVHIKRSSRDAEVDSYMLDHVRQLKFKSRPGCGVFETEMVINPDLPGKE